MQFPQSLQAAWVHGLCPKLTSKPQKLDATSSGRRHMRGHWFLFTAHTNVVHIDHIHRLGQEPPPAPTEDAFDGRSLAEVTITV